MTKHNEAAELARELVSADATPADAEAYTSPRLVVVGSTQRTLRGHHGSGQEPQGYAPKQ